MKQYRGELGFGVPSTGRIDRNYRVKLLVQVEGLERRTKRYGCPNGIVTRPAVEILRTLLLRFYNSNTGSCFPSYDAIQRASGFCRATVAKGLRLLERLGVLVITRRLVRVQDRATGWVFARQGSNVYSFGRLRVHAAGTIHTKVIRRGFRGKEVFGAIALSRLVSNPSNLDSTPVLKPRGIHLVDVPVHEV